MHIQGLAQTLLVATDRNSNSLNLKEKVGFPGSTVVKNLPANAGDAGSISGWEDPLKKEMTTRSSILAWRISWTEEPGRLQSMGSESQT